MFCWAGNTCLTNAGVQHLLIKTNSFSVVINHTRNPRSLVPNLLLFKSSIFAIRLPGCDPTFMPMNYLPCLKTH